MKHRFSETRKLEWPDYQSHPAFSSLLPEVTPFPPEAERNVEQLVREIDETFFQLSNKKSSQKETALAFTREISSRIEHLREVVRANSIDPKVAEIVSESLRRSEDRFLAQLKWMVGRFSYREKAKSRAAEVKEFREKGLVVLPIDPATYQKIQKAAEPLLEGLFAEVKAGNTGRVTAAASHTSDLWITVEKWLKSSGAIAISSDYMEGRMELLHCGLELSHPGQKWAKACYGDKGLPTAKTNYLHVDYESTSMKGMIYLTPVGPKNGPFSYIPGSHRWNRSPFLATLCRDLDDVAAETYPASDQNPAYTRKRFATEVARKGFLALPKIFQATSHFGDDILDGSDLSNRLLGEEKKFTSPEGGICILFDGSYGVHRGSLVEEDNRVAIQMAFILPEANGLISRMKRSLKKSVKQKLRRFRKS